MYLVDEKKILSLWKSNEKKRFGKIVKEFNQKLSPIQSNYDHTQINRCLKRLIRNGLLCKRRDENGPYYIPRDAPLVREYSLSNYFDKVRDFANKKGWVMDYDVGFISGITRIGFYGIPVTNSKLLTEIELDMLYSFALQLKNIFQKYQLLCALICLRIDEKSKWKPYNFYGEVFHDYIFNRMIQFGKMNLYFWDNIGIDELLSIVPNYLDFMNEIKEKYELGKNNLLNEKALEIAIELLEIPSDRAESNEVNHIDIESFDSSMLALIATKSPKVLNEYVSHPENEIKDFWTKSDGSEFSSEEIKDVIEMEKKGIEIYEEQKSRGISDMDICFGLEDLSISFTTLPNPTGLNAFKIRLNDDVISRLKKWQWLVDRIGPEGIERLVKLVKLREMNIFTD